MLDDTLEDLQTLSPPSLVVYMVQIWLLALPSVFLTLRTTVDASTTFWSCGSSRPGSSHPKSVIIVNCAWMTCFTPAPPASPGPILSSGVSTLSSTTCQLSATSAFTFTKRRTRKDARYTLLMLRLQDCMHAYQIKCKYTKICILNILKKCMDIFYANINFIIYNTNL